MGKIVDLASENNVSTGCPKIKSALGKHLELALHGFRVGIFNPKKADFILGHPVEGG